MRHAILLLSFVLIIISNAALAQCNGDVLLRTQAQVQSFSCEGGINGNLIIDEIPGTLDPITNLNPIWSNGLGIGDPNPVVTGNVTVKNCSSLTTLNGLDGILEIGGTFRIENNAQLFSTGIFDFHVVEVGHLLIADNPNFSSVEFPMLTSLQAFTLEHSPQVSNLNWLSNVTSSALGVFVNSNDMLTDLSGLNGFSEIEFLVIGYNDALTTIDGFNNLTNMGAIGILGNDNLQSISGFNNLNSIEDDLLISDNPNLESIPSFNNLFSAGNIKVENNNQLATMTGFIDLQVMTGELELSENPSLIVMPTFDILGTVSAIRILDNINLPAIQGFNGLNSNEVQTIFIAYNTSLLDIEGFDALDVLVNLEIFDNQNLETVSVLHDMVDLTHLGINQNPQLYLVDGFQSIQTLQDDIAVTENTSLSDCCWLLAPLEAAASGAFVSIENNDSGCDSQAEVESSTGDVSISCPDNVTFPTATGSCAVELNFPFPVPTTDCGEVNSMSLAIDGPLGTSL